MNEHIVTGFRDEMEKISAPYSALGGVAKRVGAIFSGGGAGGRSVGQRVSRAAKGVGKGIRKEVQTHGLGRPGKIALTGAAMVGAPALAAKHLAGKQTAKQRAFRSKMTGSYRPGAGMITPPRSY